VLAADVDRWPPPRESKGPRYLSLHRTQFLIQ
jgi:hypothetical protein